MLTRNSWKIPQTELLAVEINYTLALEVLGDSPERIDRSFPRLLVGTAVRNDVELLEDSLKEIVNSWGKFFQEFHWGILHEFSLKTLAKSLSGISSRSSFCALHNGRKK